MEIKRAFAYSDPHWGLRANSKEWLEVVYDYHINFLIPTIKKLQRPGDILYIGGDIFDSRQSINILVLNKALEVYQELAKIIPIYIILGNHDLYATQSNDIHSCKALMNIPNIHVFAEPVKFKWSNSTVQLMPWRKDAAAESEFLKGKSADYLFCHSDFVGAKQNAYVQVEHGNDLSVFSGFKQVWSGHIHWQQSLGNVTFFGSPYQITRSDANNTKKLWILDFENQTSDYIVNTRSPIFLKFDFNQILEYSVDKINQLIANNFVDLSISNSDLEKVDMKRFYQLINGYRKLTVRPIDDSVQPDSEQIKYSEYNLLEITKQFIFKINKEEEFKNAAFSKIHKLYQLVQTQKVSDN